MFDPPPPQVAGSIARALTLFRVDEVVVYYDKTEDSRAGAATLARILQRLETPQYLRRYELCTTLRNSDIRMLKHG